MLRKPSPWPTALLLTLLIPWPITAAAVETGHRQGVSVQAETRIDWVFAVANQSPATPPAKWLPDYDSTRQRYDLFVPRQYSPTKASPLVLFISPNSQATGFAPWKTVCEQEGVLFASPKTSFSGLMQYKGIMVRWPDLPEAEAAKTVLLEVQQSSDKAWEADDIAEQRKFLVARARRLSDYALGPLPPQYDGQRTQMAEAALQLWELIVEDGKDASAVADSKTMIRKLLDIQEIKKP